MSDFQTHSKLQTVVMLGSGGVGKSALTLRVVANKFVEEYDATIEDSYRKMWIVDGEVCHMEILDTAGQEEFHSLIDGWIRSADAVMFVYDIGSRQTFEELDRFHQRVLVTKEDMHCPMILVGNKCDLPDERRKVSNLDGVRLAQAWSCPFLEVSAKEHFRCAESFETLIRELRKKMGYRKKAPEKWCTLL